MFSLPLSRQLDLGSCHRPYLTSTPPGGHPFDVLDDEAGGRLDGPSYPQVNPPVSALVIQNHMAVVWTCARLSNGRFRGCPMATTSPSNDELQQLAVRLDAAALGAKDTNEMLARLTLTDDERQGALGALKMAFQYGTARSPKPGEPYFTELFGYEDGSRYPPQLSELPATISDLWSRERRCSGHADGTRSTA